ncbi:MAG: LLM class flavin-dependent oxidoreductase [Actinobacteria bacterium]|nr:LLM class flavin-dependent oxidoreductase [Actinomycetota bacterium]
MKYGTVLAVGDPRPIPELARAAEAAGWDAIFLADPVWGVAPWVTLAACAAVTGRIRLGTMLTPPSAWRPWRLAAEVATLDNLSGGRAILSVGLGATDAGFEDVGEETDRRVRAQLLDEGLDIITGLWKGQPFSYEGRRYRLTPINFPAPPPPVQQPRVPIWCVGLGAIASRWTGRFATTGCCRMCSAMG